VPAESARIEELRRRVASDPASVAFAVLAEEYRRAGRYDDAIATCRTGLGRHPSYVSARVTLGRALVETGNYEDARLEFEHVLRLAPENLAAIRALAALHERFDDSAPSVAGAPATAVVAPSAATAGLPSASQPDAQAGPSDCALSSLESFLAAIQKNRREPQNSRSGSARLT
jgi:tetratricopeptide (TPR) repeat protein